MKEQSWALSGPAGPSVAPLGQRLRSRPNFQANRVRRRKFGKRQPGGGRAGFLALCRPTANHSFLSLSIRCARPRGGGRGFRFPLPTLTTSPLALSRFLRRATAGACKNRSAAPAAAPCFVHWTRSPPLPWTQKRKSQRSKAGKNNSSWPVQTFRASNGERVFSDRPLPAAPILSSNPTRRPIVEPLRPVAAPPWGSEPETYSNIKPPLQNHGARVCFDSRFYIG